ncbi:hypothetical protein [Streptomyces sp. NPDC048436]|uniref:hypothetical protein n=1 Tax=Streptomyces sp. NPDC048436 TaxID=3365550 RepID=UPI00370F7A80
MTTAPSQRAADDLLAVREQWGDLLAAIAHPPAAEWPPREARGFLEQLATDDQADDDEQPGEPVLGRLPLTIREHPAPLNLDALDAALDVERDLFDLADQVAEQVQRPIRRASADRDDPARWHYQAATSPGSRTYGLHWAAVWIEGRALGETVGEGLFEPMPARLLDRVAAVARRTRRTVECALGRDGRTTELEQPCPWCAGQLQGHTQAGGEPVVICRTGATCSAPAPLDERDRRAWRGADLVGLWSALLAEREGASP